MKSRFSAYVILLSMCLSAACGLSAETEIPATPTDTAPPPTATPLPTAAAPLVTDTPEPTPTSAGTPLPTPTPEPTKVPPPFLGNSIMGMELIGPNFSVRAPVAADAGSYWIRWNAILWSSIEPTQGDRIWQAMSNFEQQVVNINNNGMRMIAIVRSTPLWAQRDAGSYCGPVAAGSLEAFGDFMYDLVYRYSIPPFNIKYWEIGNEPDVDPKFVSPDSLFGCWGDIGDPYYGGATYAEMLKAVYPRIKEADPEAQVLVGGLLADCNPDNPPETNPGSGVLKDCTPSLYLEGILMNGGGDFFDGVSFHAYDLYDPITGYFGNPNWHSGVNLSGLTPVLIPKSRYLKSVLAEYGYFDKYLFNTETSLLCGRTGREPECSTGKFDQMKARYIPMTYAAAQAEGLQGNIWFTLDNAWRKSSLITPQGAATDAYIAYRFVADALRGKAFWGQVGGYPGVVGYKFRLDDTEIWIMWSQDALAHVVDLGNPPLAIRDHLGSSLPVAQTIEVGVAPIYIYWGP